MQHKQKAAKEPANLLAHFKKGLLRSKDNSLFPPAAYLLVLSCPHLIRAKKTTVTTVSNSFFKTLSH